MASKPLDRRTVLKGLLATDLRPESLDDCIAEVTLDTVETALDGILAGEARGRWVVRVAPG